MIWLLRSRRVAPLSALAILVVSITTIGARWYVPIPALATPAGIGVPLALALPVVVGVLVLGCLLSREPGLEVSAARSITAADAILGVALLALTVGPLLVAGLWSSNMLLTAGARNVAAVVGLGLLLKSRLSPAASTLIPVVHAAACFSLANRYEPQMWAWLMADGRSMSALFIAASLLAAGAVAGLGDYGRRQQLRWIETD